MNIVRRKFLRSAASAAVLPALPRAAAALEYPIRPVHIVVGLPPGLTPDIGARIIAQSLSERLETYLAVRRTVETGQQQTPAVRHLQTELPSRGGENLSGTDGAL